MFDLVGGLVSTHLKNRLVKMGENLPQIRVNIKNIRNHHLVLF